MAMPLKLEFHFDMNSFGRVSDWERLNFFCSVWPQPDFSFVSSKTTETLYQHFQNTQHCSQSSGFSLAFSFSFDIRRDGGFSLARLHGKPCTGWNQEFENSQTTNENHRIDSMIYDALDEYVWMVLWMWATISSLAYEHILRLLVTRIKAKFNNFWCQQVLHWANKHSCDSKMNFNASVEL